MEVDIPLPYSGICAHCICTAASGKDKCLNPVVTTLNKERIYGDTTT